MKFNGSNVLFDTALKSRYEPPKIKGIYNHNDYELMVEFCNRLGNSLNEIFEEVLIITLVKSCREGYYSIVVLAPLRKFSDSKPKVVSVMYGYGMESTGRPSYSSTYVSLRDQLIREGATYIDGEKE